MQNDLNEASERTANPGEMPPVEACPSSAPPPPAYRLAPRAQRWLAALAVVALCTAIFAAMCILSGVKPGTYSYPTYLLQAQAWLRGQFALDHNYEFLELAVYNGQYYVSFPPVPTIPMVLWTLIWGDAVPGGLFQKIYVALSCLVVLGTLLHARSDEPESLRRELARRQLSEVHPSECVLWTIFLCLGSALLSITLVGGVWYEAQILAFLFSVSAIASMRRGRSTLSCFLYALAVGCRPFSICLGPALLMLYLHRMRDASPRAKILRLLPGLAAGLCVAACYAVYNYARFGNIFEFGHNYLPEFTRTEEGQFSLSYIAQNWRTLFFGAPFTVEGDSLLISAFGFSMFLSCPILLCNVIWLLSDLVKRRFTPAKLVILLMMALNTLLLLLHRTLGGYQFGLRYALELVPLSFCYLLLSPERARASRWEFFVMACGLLFNFAGGIIVHV